MSFIGVNRLLAIGWLALRLCAPATAAEAPPPVMQEPVLGLRYDPATVKFDPLPDHVRIKCMEYANTAKWRSHLWIYALARDGARIHYVVGGYRERLHPAPSESRFELDKLGGVISIEGERSGCASRFPGKGPREPEVLESPTLDRSSLTAALHNRLKDGQVERLASAASPRVDHRVDGARTYCRNTKPQGRTSGTRTTPMPHANSVSLA